jgi:polyisoprenoid-binding protein YceI
MTTTVPTIAAGTYRLLAARCAIRFHTRGMFGRHAVSGTFAVRDGTVVVTEDPRGSRVQATVDTASFDTGNARRDKDVRSRRFLHTDRYPSMSFVSGELAAGPDGGWRMAGMLTVRGVTTPVTLALGRVAATADGLTARATTRIDRYARGLTGSRGLVARYLDVELDITAAR